MDARSSEMLKQALPLMSRHAAHYRPTSYALWFEYLTGRVAGLRSEVDSQIRESPRLTDEQTQELYDRFLVGAREQALGDAQSRMLQALDAVDRSIDDAASNSGEICEYLLEFSTDIETLEDPAALKASASQAVAEARRAQSAFESVKAELTTSRREVERLNAEIAGLRDAAQVDDLTGLGNRRAFERALADTIATATARGEELAVIVIEFDAFATFRAEHGSAIADQGLAAIADAIRTSTRGRDTVARTGEIEFSVLLRESGAKAAATVAEYVRRIVERTRLRRADSDQAVEGLSISCGVAALGRLDTGTALVQRALLARRAASAAGGNRVQPPA